MLPPLSLERSINKIVREEWGRILASLVKHLGDIQLAEDCLQDAVISAMNHWGKNGLPNSPAAWLITVARRSAIDELRRRQNFASKQAEISYLLDLANRDAGETGSEIIPDKRLELIFTCCHPALSQKTQVALTLRTLCGLSTEEIASAFLDKPDAMQQRLTRAKKKISQAAIPYHIPEADDLQGRLSSVLRVIYLIFNEGYSASVGESLIKTNLSDEAIRLARILRHLMPDETEVSGLLALVLLHDSRRNARISPTGQMIPLADQNRSRWNKSQICEGVTILEMTLPQRRIGAYQLQAAISAVHAQSPTWEETDWPEILALYNLLYALQPTPVVRVNHAVALSYAKSPNDALMVLEAAFADGELGLYQPFYAAKADLLQRLDRRDEADEMYRIAIDLSENDQERGFLQNQKAVMNECGRQGTTTQVVRSPLN